MKHNFVFAFEIHFGSTQERQYIPSEDMGDYEEYKKKKSPKKSGPLYPLNEEVNSRASHNYNSQPSL